MLPTNELILHHSVYAAIYLAFAMILSTVAWQERRLRFRRDYGAFVCATIIGALCALLFFGEAVKVVKLSVGIPMVAMKE